MTMRLSDQPAAQGQQSGKHHIESFQPLTSGMVNVFSARWIPDSAAVELLNNNGIDPTRPAKRDGYEEIRQTTTGIRAALLDNRASGLGYLSPSLGTKLLVMAIQDGGSGGIFYTPDPDLVPWAEAFVGGPVIVPTTLTYNLFDDAPVPAVTAPRGTWKVGSEIAGVIDFGTFGAFATKAAIIVTEAGSPNIADWPEDTISITLKFTGPGAAGLNAQVAVHRYNASNVSQQASATTATQNIADVGSTLAFSVPAPGGGWTPDLATDRFAVIASVNNTTGLSLDTDIITGDGTSFALTAFVLNADSSVEWDPLTDDVKMFQANDRLWILPNPDILLAIIDNTGFLTLSGTANEDAPDGIVDGVYFLNRVWLIDEHNKLYWSMLLPVSPVGSFDRATDSLTFSPNRGSRIVAIRPWQTSVLLLFFNDSVEQMIVDNSNVLGGSTRELIEPDFGCCSRDGVRAVGDDFYFIDQYMQVRSLAQTEQQKTTGVVKEPLSHAIREEIPGRVNPAFKHRMRLHTEGDELHVFFPRGTSEQCDYRAVYSMTYERWVAIDRLADGVAKILRSDIRGEWETYLLDGDDTPAVPLVTITDQGTFADNGEGIEFSLTSKALTFECAEAMKFPHAVALEWFGDTGATPIVEVRTDEAGSWTALDLMAGDTQVGTFGASAFPLLPGDFPLLPADFPLTSEADTSALAWARYRMDSDVIGRFRSAQVRVRQAAEGSEGVEFQVIAWHFIAQPGCMELLNG